MKQKPKLNLNYAFFFVQSIHWQHLLHLSIFAALIKYNFLSFCYKRILAHSKMEKQWQEYTSNGGHNICVCKYDHIHKLLKPFALRNVILARVIYELQSWEHICCWASVEVAFERGKMLLFPLLKHVMLSWFPIWVDCSIASENISIKTNQLRYRKNIVSNLLKIMYLNSQALYFANKII